MEHERPGAADLIETMHPWRDLHLAIRWAAVTGRAEPVAITLTADPPRAITKQDLKDLPLAAFVADRRRVLTGAIDPPPVSGKVAVSSDQVLSWLEDHRAAIWDGARWADEDRKRTGRPSLPAGHYAWVSRVAMDAWQGGSGYVRAVAMGDGCECGHKPGRAVHPSAPHEVTKACTKATCNLTRELKDLAPYRGGITNYRSAARWVSEARRRGLPMPPSRVEEDW